MTNRNNDGPTRADTWGIVLAAGTGTRLGQRKQFLQIDGTRLVDLAVQTLVPFCEGIVVVLPPETTWDGLPVAAVVEGGATRIESARRGLELIPQSARVVVIHDAAHPLASESLLGSLIAAVSDGDVEAALPVLPTTETIMRVREGEAVETVPRRGLVAVQVPQVFKAQALRAAHTRAGEVSDDGALMQQVGAKIQMVRGELSNVHVATSDDLDFAAQLSRLLPIAMKRSASK